MSDDADAKARATAHGLIQGYIGPDHKVLDMAAFYSALVQAFKDALTTNRKFYGVYRGTVVNNDDPMGRGRVQVSLPSLLNDNKIWALPSIPIGTEIANLPDLVPEIDTDVWLLFEGGDLNYPIWIGRTFTRR